MGRRRLALLLSILCLCASSSSAIRAIPGAGIPRFAEAPEYRNGDGCPISSRSTGACDPSDVHIAMTLDLDYLRGSMAAVLSVLHHASCPNSIFFHFISSQKLPTSNHRLLHHLVRSTFPSLRFKIYSFDDSLVSSLIAPSIREALEKPLNYARNHIADLLESCVHRVIYLDSDVIAVDDIARLWSTPLSPLSVIAAPEYCHANFTSYFTPAFWDHPVHSRAFDARRNKPCYFNTGVMVMDLEKWRKGMYGDRIRAWMEVQKKGDPRIYDLGSLPPFLLVFAGEVEAVDHSWNQHGLGGDNVVGSCRELYPGPVSLLHWSGKGKPWARLDSGNPCPLDHLWAPFDLYLRPSAAAASSSHRISSALL